MEIAAYFSLLIVLSFLLVKAADMIEDAFVLVAKKLGISPFLIGFFVLAAMSSLPEASVALTSAIDQVPSLSVGNLIGATFTILTLIIGGNAIKQKKLPFKGKFGVSQVFLALLLLFLQIFVIVDGELRFEEGILLIACYALFVIYIAEHAREHKHLKEDSTIQVGTLGPLLVRGVLGLVALIALAKFTVDVAVVFADLIHVPKSIVGILVLAIGTNLPELALLFRSNGVEQQKLAIGNFLGSASLNTGILGFLTVLSPHQLTSLPDLVIPIVLMGLALALFAIFTFTDKELTKREGIVLLGVYAFFIVTQVAKILGVL